MNIASINDRCRYVSDEVRKQSGQKNICEIGEEVVCRLYCKENSSKFNANMTTKNIKSKEIHTLDEGALYRRFRQGYCATCRSCQGASKKNSITIHEWQGSRLASRDWAWMAITRAAGINNVSFFENAEAEQERAEQKLIVYFENKIEGYKQQDRKTPRKLNLDNFVDVDFFVRIG